ncbi:MAG TPA: cobyrinate a,c-diamide synthase [Solirubrobacteraceae bacterium]|nr:cobyrinate a,c-diamide synthase [Solirubrobacteraceae bacterium]
MTPRVVIGGTASGVGKTSIACGLIAALRARGLRVQGFKVGPDFIDPGHHALASGRPGRNLDAFMSGARLIAPLFRHGARGADIAVIEGVMGLFDGAVGRGELASTAQVAKLLGAPVLLVADVGGMARSVAALVHGYRTFDPDLRIAGVILNRVGSEHHELLVRDALRGLGLPVLGALRRDEALRAPERHLGLVPAAERPSGALWTLARLRAAVERQLDLSAIVAIAATAEPLQGPVWSPEPPPGQLRGRSARIGLAGGRAFSFHYEENLELLRAAGAELAPFDPLSDGRLPEGCDALLLAGGFPEVFGAELSANEPLRAAIRSFGGPILAECGGLLYLCRELDGQPMCGKLAATASMTRRLALGYREARAARATPWLAEGATVRGHEFHYSRTQGADGLPPAWELAGRGRDGFVAGPVQAGYLHVHWAAYPQIAWRFARPWR